jgi:hypothetical protein
MCNEMMKIFHSTTEQLISFGVGQIPEAKG